MIKIIIFNVAKCLKDLGLLGAFLTFLFFDKGYLLMIAWLLACALFSLLFACIMGYFESEFVSSKYFKLCDEIYSLSFYTCGIGVILNLINKVQNYDIYYTSLALLVFGLVGKIICSKINN